MGSYMTEVRSGFIKDYVLKFQNKYFSARNIFIRANKDDG